MRLTLRTMLAYLDDVLDPADTQELEHKIEESSFASGLVHRVRDSMRRMRLGAPKLEGNGLGLDPNTVADYLDSTLPPERVPEFEKVCLESDVHLAEVASCHQILTLVLGEPAEVDPAMRERIYRIGHTARQPTPTTGGNGATTSATQSNAARSTGGTSAPTVDRSVGGPRSSQLPVKSLALTLLLGFFFALVALQAIGINRIRGWVGLPVREVVQNTPRDVTGTTNPEVTIRADTVSTSKETQPPSAASSVEANVSPPKLPRLDSPMPSPADGSPDIRPDEPMPETPTASDDSAARAVDPPSVEVVETAPPVQREMAADAVEEIGPEAADNPSRPADVSVAVEPPRQVAVGRYISEQQVLARFDEKAGDWFRLVPDSPLLTGQRIISLPAYRPQLLLAPSIKVTLAGESHLELGRTEEGTAPLLKIDTGRAIIVPLGPPQAAVHLHAAGRTGSVVFADAESALALEVKRYLPPGQRPELEPAIPVIQLFTLSGHVAWQEGDAEEFVIGPGQVLTMEGDGGPALFEAGELPAWIVGNLSDIDRLASDELRDLATDRPLSLSLLERTGFRRVEVRSLACRSLCSLGMFDPAIEALDGSRLRSYWYAQFDALREAIARSPESAVKLRRSLEKLAGDEADSLYELLCGFSPDQLASGGAEQLVDTLESERVIARVLAYENLRRITDKTQLFRPEQPPSQQKGEVMKWRRNLASGAIVYQQLPRALPSRVPVADETTPVTK